MTITPEDLQALIRDYSIEITPKAAQKIGDFRPWLTEGTQVYVPNLRGTKISDCIDTCELLQNQQMRAVPHIVLRNYRSEAELRQTLDRVQALGIDRILLLAGAASQPLGPYDSVMSMLKTGLLQHYRFAHIGFAGHPEGAADILRTVGRKGVQVEIPYPSFLHPIIGHGRRLDGLTGNLKLHDLAR